MTEGRSCITNFRSGYSWAMIKLWVPIPPPTSTTVPLGMMAQSKPTTTVKVWYKAWSLKSSYLPVFAVG